MNEYICDEPMRRSKERCDKMVGYLRLKWTCTGNCSRCICAMHKDRHGEHAHTNYRTIKSEELK